MSADPRVSMSNGTLSASSARDPDASNRPAAAVTLPLSVKLLLLLPTAGCPCRLPAPADGVASLGEEAVAAAAAAVGAWKVFGMEVPILLLVCADGWGPDADVGGVIPGVEVAEGSFSGMGGMEELRDSPAIFGS